MFTMLNIMFTMVNILMKKKNTQEDQKLKLIEFKNLEIEIQFVKPQTHAH